LDEIHYKYESFFSRFFFHYIASMFKKSFVDLLELYFEVFDAGYDAYDGGGGGGWL
jgi:hypothetical protein